MLDNSSRSIRLLLKGVADFTLTSVHHLRPTLRIDHDLPSFPGAPRLTRQRMSQCSYLIVAFTMETNTTRCTLAIADQYWLFMGITKLAIIA
jgi:hypothetical protein